jgi:hypothetical protein
MHNGLNVVNKAEALVRVAHQGLLDFDCVQSSNEYPQGAVR